MTHFRGFWGDFRESYILLHVLSKLPIVLLVLLALSVGVVVQAWVGIATESTPWSEKLAVRVGMSGVYFGKDAFVMSGSKALFPFLAGRCFIIILWL